MPLTKWSKPRQVTLPGGYLVPIVYWSARRMGREKARDSSMDTKDLLGYWDGERIVINADEPLWIQIETLGHELVHATHDYALWLKQTYADPIKQEAGQTLMDMNDE